MLRHLSSASVLAWALLSLQLLTASWADPAVTLVGQPSQLASSTVKQETFQPWRLSVDAVNRSRDNDQLVVYTSRYGDTTHTNPYGVEVWAKPVTLGAETQYEVLGVSNIWECDKQGQRNRCGNAPIPPGGVVLSASGKRRQELLATFRPGVRFSMQTQLFRQQQAVVDVVNPNDRNNPKGRTYPGLRGSGQLIVYTPDYGQPTTGTNEYGFEVTVVNGRVTEANGANSPIPPDGFVLSGHGKMRDWLIQSAPVGAKITWQQPMTLIAQPLPVTNPYGTVTATVDYDSYREPFLQALAQVEQRGASSATQPLRTKLAKADSLASGSPEQAVQLLQAATGDLDRLLWKTYPQFGQQAVRAVWHRPVEMSREQVANTLNRFQKAGLNTVFLETIFHGYPLFASQTYTRYGIAANQYPTFAGKDVLTWWLTEAHQRGMKLHTWFQVFYAGNKAVEGLGPVLTRYPQWANVQRSAVDSVTPQPSTLELGHYFLDPANPQVQQFLTELLEELVTTYPVDGVQLDYIRYPNSFPPERLKYLETTWGYSAVARRAFQQESGVDPIDLTVSDPVWPAWNLYKAQQVTGFVDKAQQIVRQAASRRGQPIQLSAAIFPQPGMALLLKHQDWSRWLANGWVDFLAPMSLTGAVNAVQDNVASVVGSQMGATPQVVSGVFGPFNNLPAQRLMEQLEASLKGGASGYAIFDSAHLTQDMVQALAIWQGKQPVTSTGMLSPAPQTVPTNAPKKPTARPAAPKPFNRPWEEPTSWR